MKRLNIEEIEKEFEDYNEEFDNSDFMDIDTHTSMAMQVGPLIDRIKELEAVLHKYAKDDTRGEKAREALGLEA